MSKDKKIEPFKTGQRYLIPEENWDRLYPSEYNVRKTDIQGTVEWEELKASIKRDGILEDLDVTPKGAIVDGQRRYKLIREIVVEEDLECEELGTVRTARTIPVMCGDFSPEEQIKHSLNKNILRKDVGAHDIARSLADLVEILGTQKAVAEFLGHSDTWVSERLSILSTPERTFDEETEQVKEKKSEPLPLEKVPKSKLSDVGALITSTKPGSKRLRKVIAEEASKLPRDQLKELKKEVKREKKKEDIPPEKVLEKIEEKKKKVQRTVNRTFRLDTTINDALTVAEGRGLIEDRHIYVNELLVNGLKELGVLGER